MITVTTDIERLHAAWQFVLSQQHIRDTDPDTIFRAAEKIAENLKRLGWQSPRVIKALVAVGP